MDMERREHWPHQWCCSRGTAPQGPPGSSRGEHLHHHEQHRWNWYGEINVWCYDLFVKRANRASQKSRTEENILFETMAPQLRAPNQVVLQQYESGLEKTCVCCCKLCSVSCSTQQSAHRARLTIQDEKIKAISSKWSSQKQLGKSGAEKRVQPRPVHHTATAYWSSTLDFQHLRAWQLFSVVPGAVHKDQAAANGTTPSH